MGGLRSSREEGAGRQDAAVQQQGEPDEEEQGEEGEEGAEELDCSAPAELNEDAPAGEGGDWLESELYSALKRAERAETERAEISRLLVARERDIQDLKKRLESRKSAFLLHGQNRGAAARRDWTSR